MSLIPVPNRNQEKSSPYADLVPGFVPALLPSLEECLPVCKFKTHILRVPGAMVWVSEPGGQALKMKVTSPAGRVQDVYYLSPNADLTGEGNPIRGGGQLAGWPNFGKGELALPKFDEGDRIKLPAHGLLRVKNFGDPQFRSARPTNQNQEDSIRLTTTGNTIDLQKWRYPFIAATEVVLSCDHQNSTYTLTSSVGYFNTGQVPVPIQGFFHNYFAIGDAANVRVVGPSGRNYIDLSDLSHHAQEKKSPHELVNGHDLIGRMYPGLASAQIIDGVLGRRIRVTGGLPDYPAKTGQSDTVLWNPGTLPPNEGEPKDWKYPFLPHGANEEMLCLESGSRGRLVQPGEAVTISQHIVVDWYQGA